MPNTTETKGKVQDVKDKTTEMKNTASENVKQWSQNQSKSLDDAKQQLITYGSQIQEYLGKINAKVETYKFSVEKMENGLSVDIAFKATIQSSVSTTDEISK